MSGWTRILHEKTVKKAFMAGGAPHRDFSLRIEDDKDSLPIVTLHFRKDASKVKVENHRTGASYEIDLVVRG